jgi:hypothetical protein
MRSFPSLLQRGLKQVIIGHHDAMLITYRRQDTSCKTTDFTGLLIANLSLTIVLSRCSLTRMTLTA